MSIGNRAETVSHNAHHPDDVVSDFCLAPAQVFPPNPKEGMKKQSKKCVLLSSCFVLFPEVPAGPMCH